MLMEPFVSRCWSLTRNQVMRREAEERRDGGESQVYRERRKDAKLEEKREEKTGRRRVQRRGDKDLAFVVPIRNIMKLL